MEKTNITSKIEALDSKFSTLDKISYKKGLGIIEVKDAITFQTVKRFVYSITGFERNYLEGRYKEILKEILTDSPPQSAPQIQTEHKVNRSGLASLKRAEGLIQELFTGNQTELQSAKESIFAEKRNAVETTLPKLIGHLKEKSSVPTPPNIFSFSANEAQIISDLKPYLDLLPYIDIKARTELSNQLEEKAGNLETERLAVGLNLSDKEKNARLETAAALKTAANKLKKTPEEDIKKTFKKIHEREPSSAEIEDIKKQLDKIFLSNEPRLPDNQLLDEKSQKHFEESYKEAFKNHIADQFLQANGFPLNDEAVQSIRTTLIDSFADIQKVQTLTPKQTQQYEHALNLHSEFTKQYGFVITKHSQPQPTMVQLKEAERVVKEIIIPDMNSPEDKIFAARLTQTLLMGQAVTIVPFPTVETYDSLEHAVKNAEAMEQACKLHEKLKKEVGSIPVDSHGQPQPTFEQLQKAFSLAADPKNGLPQYLFDNKLEEKTDAIPLPPYIRTDVAEPKIFAARLLQTIMVGSSIINTPLPSSECSFSFPELKEFHNSVTFSFTDKNTGNERDSIIELFLEPITSSKIDRQAALDEGLRQFFRDGERLFFFKYKDKEYRLKDFFENVVHNDYYDFLQKGNNLINEKDKADFFLERLGLKSIRDIEQKLRDIASSQNIEQGYLEALLNKLNLPQEKLESLSSISTFSKDEINLIFHAKALEFMLLSLQNWRAELPADYDKDPQNIGVAGLELSSKTGMNFTGGTTVATGIRNEPISISDDFNTINLTQDFKASREATIEENKTEQRNAIRYTMRLQMPSLMTKGGTLEFTSYENVRLAPDLELLNAVQAGISTGSVHMP